MPKVCKGSSWIRRVPWSFFFFFLRRTLFHLFRALITVIILVMVIAVIAVIVVVVNSYFLMVFLVGIQYFFQVLVHFVVIHDIVVIVIASDGFQKAQGLVSTGEGVAGRDGGSVVALMGASR